MFDSEDLGKQFFLRPVVVMAMQRIFAGSSVLGVLSFSLLWIHAI